MADRKTNRNSSIKKAVILAAGFGTRFLPASKASPKEMLALVDKPVIQYLVEDAVKSGINEIVLVTGKNKRAIEDHFDRSHELEMFLKAKGKKDLVELVKKVSSLASFAYVRQKEQKGTADAVLEASPFIGHEPFAVTSGDDIIESDSPVLGQLAAVYEKYKAPVTCLMRVPMRETHKYGVIEGREVAPRVWKITRAVEKPAPGTAPTNLATLTKFVLTPDFLPYLSKAKPLNGEYYIPPAMDLYIKSGGAFYGYEVKGEWFDCGNKLGYMKGAVHYALRHPEIGKAFREYLRSLDI